MAINDYIKLGGVEIVNSARLFEYLTSVGSPLTTFSNCACPTFNNTIVGDEPYTTPDDPLSPAPWYDPDVPESVEFAGLMLLSIDGMDEYPVTRSTTTAVSGGASLGPTKVQARTLTFTAVLLGSTCCGVEYGLHWLAEALNGCTTTGGSCDGDCLELYNCCPGTETTPAQFNDAHHRTLLRVGLTDGPRVTGRIGDGCSNTVGQCQSGADILTVEWTLTATTPWAWTDVTPLLEVVPPSDDTPGCVTWCFHPPVGGIELPGCGGTCRLAECADPEAGCDDAVVAPSVADSCFCVPLATVRECFDIDLTGRPMWSVDAPVFTVRAGSSGLCGLTITIYERSSGDAALTCEEIAVKRRCEPHSVYYVQTMAAGEVLTLDGRVGRAIVQCRGECGTSMDVYGQDGGPVQWNTLDCAQYCICLETDVMHPPAADAAVLLGVSGRGY